MSFTPKCLFSVSRPRGLRPFLTPALPCPALPSASDMRACVCDISPRVCHPYTSDTYTEQRGFGLTLDLSDVPLRRVVSAHDLSQNSRECKQVRGQQRVIRKIFGTHDLCVVCISRSLVALNWDTMGVIFVFIYILTY